MRISRLLGLTTGCACAVKGGSDYIAGVGGEGLGWGIMYIDKV